MTFSAHDVRACPGDDASTPVSGSGCHWYAVQSKPRGEEVASHTLQTLGLEVFLPRVRRGTTRPSPVHAPRPLFPGYLFARLHPTQHLHAVRYSRGVLRVLGGREHPVPVDDRSEEACRQRLDRDGFVLLEEPGLRPGDRLRIEFGPFAGFEGVFVRTLDDSSRVMILLEAMQQAQLILERRHLVPA